MAPDATADVTALFRAAGMADPFPSPADDPELFAEVGDALKAIETAEPKFEQGSTQVLVRDVHLQLGALTWEVVEFGVRLGMAAMDPSGVSRGEAGRKLLELLWKVRNLVQRLDPAGLVVCRAVLSAQESTRMVTLKAEGASVQEIEEDFRRRGQEVPPMLAAVVARLVSDKVLVSEQFGAAGPFYRVSF